MPEPLLGWIQVCTGSLLSMCKAFGSCQFPVSNQQTHPQQGHQEALERMVGHLATTSCFCLASIGSLQQTQHIACFSILATISVAETLNSEPQTLNPSNQTLKRQ